MSLSRTRLLGVASVSALVLLAGSMAISHPDLTGYGTGEPSCSASASESPSAGPSEGPSPSPQSCPSSSESPSYGSKPKPSKHHHY